MGVDLTSRTLRITLFSKSFFQVDKFNDLILKNKVQLKYDLRGLKLLYRIKMIIELSMFVLA